MSSVLSRLKKKPRSPAHTPYDMETACIKHLNLHGSADVPWPGLWEVFVPTLTQSCSEVNSCYAETSTYHAPMSSTAT